MANYKKAEPVIEATPELTLDASVWLWFRKELIAHDYLINPTAIALDQDKDFRELLCQKFNFSNSIVSHLSALIDEYIRREYIQCTPNGKAAILVK